MGLNVILFHPMRIHLSLKQNTLKASCDDVLTVKDLIFLQYNTI